MEEKSDIRTKLVVGSFFGAVVYDTIAKKFRLMQISTLMRNISNYAVRGFVLLGNKTFQMFGQISQVIKLKDLCESTSNLIYPVFELAFAPYRFAEGLILSAKNVEGAGYIIVTGVAVSAVVLTLMEINMSEKYKPSNVLMKSGEYIKRGYSYFGRFISDLSSFYRILGFEQFYNALIKVILSFKTILIAPIISTLNGYYNEIKNTNKYGKHVIGLGSLTLFLLGLYGCSKLYPGMLMNIQLSSAKFW